MLRIAMLSVLLGIVGSLVVTPPRGWCGEPIYDYVAAPDAAFKWEKVAEKPTPSGADVRLEMTSQVWQGITWKHRLAIVKPSQPRHPDQCMLVITGGDPGGDMFQFASMISMLIGMPIAVLGDIPNQPLFDGLSEDGLIAHTFVKYLETKDPTWPALFPMTKSAVRAMDAVQQLSEKEWGKKVESFIVTGASKRGWTTWFTGEVDKRAKAIIPMVYDNLNLAAQMAHQKESFGGTFSEQIEDYTKQGLPDLLISEEGRALGRMVDPYTYRDKATMPKLMVTGTNDRYWPLDAASAYFNDLVGPKYIIHVPNSGHGLDDRGRVIGAVIGFAAATVGDLPLPKLSWAFTPADNGLTLTGKSDLAPKQVLVWTATAPALDFRESKWTSQKLTAQDGAYSFTMPKPATGHAAFFLEFAYPGKGTDFPLTTELRVL